MKRHVQGRAEPAWQGAHGVFPGSSPEVTCPVNGPAGGGGTAPMWALSLQRQEGTVSPRADMLRCPCPWRVPRSRGASLWLWRPHSWCSHPPSCSPSSKGTSAAGR